MANFNFFLNRQGVRGNKGEQGEQGYSPRITVKTETAAEYVLNVQNEDGSFDTPNLRGNAIENLGGTYVRFNQDTEQMYTGYADTASTTSQGEVVLSTYEDLTSGGDEGEVTTSKDVHDFVEAKISEASVNYVDIDDYTQKMGELDSEISDLDENKLDFTGLTNTLAAGTNITITPNAQTGKITIAGEPVSQAQADWNQTDIDAPDYIKNKPVIDNELSSTSTNAVQNRLVTNAINLISNEFENYATNKLDNLSDEGEARLHALKAYSDNGEVLTDSKGLQDVISYSHSSFDLSKFTAVGATTITDNGIASGFVSLTNYITGSFTPTTATSRVDLWCKCYADSTTANGSVLFAVTNNLRLIKNNSLSFGVRGLTGVLGCNTPNLTLSDGDEVILHAIVTSTNATIESWVNGTKQRNGQLTGDYSGILTEYSAFTVGGQYNNGNYSPNEAIDLKYCKVFIDGVEVFSGNKTGIDTIKPDDYTVVGTPTISADGVASGFSNSNALTQNISIASGSNVIINLDVTNGKWSSGQYQMPLQLCASDNTPILTVSRYYTKLRIEGSESPANTLITNSSAKITLDTDLATYIKCYVNSVLVIDTTFTNSVNVAKVSIGNHIIPEGWKSWSGSIDLNSVKIYVDGNLVYQPCLKIPYTESKTGSKIVNAVYRDRVNDMASQFGYANYYTLDEDNGNFTLPQVELYGLIEKAASTVPSGVVQSSTISNIVSLTQAEYDALTTKDSNTCYIITPST